MRGAAKYLAHIKSKEWNLNTDMSFRDFSYGTKDYPKITGVEVGVWNGLNAFEMLLGFPSMHLHLVDCYEREYSERAKKIAEYILAPFKDRITWHIKKSVEASSEFEDGSLDFVYIDAAHDYKSVKDDISVWYPKAKDGAIFGGHDYVSATETNGVRKAVHEFVLNRDSKVMWFPESCDWWIRK